MAAHAASFARLDDTLDEWLRLAALGARRAGRLAAWAVDPASFARPALASGSAHFPHAVHESTISLQAAPFAVEPLLAEGRRVNLELAAAAFDGLLLDPARPFSFWRTLGRVSEARGFRPGLDPRGGCVEPVVGGGLCVLASALFAAAVRLGFRIVERHGPAQETVPPAGSPWGLDAAVRWPHVDLRFSVREPMRLDVRLEGESLVLRVRAMRPAEAAFELVVLEDRLERTEQGDFRRNRVGRRRAGSTERLELVAENRRRLVGPFERRRGCVGCHQRDLHPRTSSGGPR